MVLAHNGLLRVRGADAASFLHGQLTHDFSNLRSDQARLAAYCSPKGRMLASFVGFKHEPDEIWLVSRADLIPATLKRLRMFVLRAKAQLDEGDGSTVLLGLAGAAAASALAMDEADRLPVWGHRPLGSGASVVRLPDGDGVPRWLWAGSAASAQALRDALPPLTLAHWDWLEVASGIAPIGAATVDAFVPQMLNYELVGGVNFQKGCYPGQEIVARSQYRGTLKRRTLRVHGDAPMQPGQEVFWSGDAAQPSGLIAAAAPAPAGGWEALAELKLAALDSGSLHLGSPEGARLTLRTLPYALPRADATADA